MKHCSSSSTGPWLGPHTTTDKRHMWFTFQDASMWWFLYVTKQKWRTSPQNMSFCSSILSTSCNWIKPNFYLNSASLFVENQLRSFRSFQTEELTGWVKSPWPTLRLMAYKRGCSLCNRHRGTRWYQKGRNLGESSSAPRHAEAMKGLWRHGREKKERERALFPHSSRRRRNWLIIKKETWYAGPYWFNCLCLQCK